MSALVKIRLAGFEVAFDGDVLKIRPFSGLSEEQRAFLKEHKADVLKELRQEQFEHGQIQAPEIDPLANRIDELVAAGWEVWNARAKAESEMLTTAGHVATATTINQPTRIGFKY